MDILTERITRQDLIDRYTKIYPRTVKAVVDVQREIIALHAEWHADLETFLLEKGSTQGDLWGFNFQPFEPFEAFIVYESLINIRPAEKNFSIEISDTSLRARIHAIVMKWVDYQESAGVKEPEAQYDRDLALPQGFGGHADYPCFKHHKQVTMEKWRSFKPWQRVLMIANEFGRAKALLHSVHADDLFDCYERALEIFHMTVEAAHIEHLSPEIISGLLHLRERTAQLLVERRIDPEENQGIREALIRLDPEGYKLFQKPENVDA